MATKRSAPKKSASTKKKPKKAAPKRAAKKPKAPARPTVPAEQARAAFERLSAAHPDAHCELDHVDPFQLVVAVVLSAQTTDAAVNKLTPELFEKYPTPAALAVAKNKDVERILSRIGFFRQKTKSIIGLSKKLVEDHGGEVPKTMAELVKLPGVGRKTANVILGVAFKTPEGVVVDTHVQRLAQRLGWSGHSEPEEIEQDLMAIFPRERWDAVGHVLIFQGRRVCAAIKPNCEGCAVKDTCPSAFAAVEVGRKPPRKRPPRPKKKKK